VDVADVRIAKDPAAVVAERDSHHIHIAAVVAVVAVHGYNQVVFHLVVDNVSVVQVQVV
jgi:hypothetical protein